MSGGVPKMQKHLLATTALALAFTVKQDIFHILSYYVEASLAVTNFDRV